MLTRARGRCECCRAHEHQRALEVDHIIPRNQGGSDAISNLQGLCYRCNAGKRDTPTTDFRGMLASYGRRQEGCWFCVLEASGQELLEHELADCIVDAYPVTKGRSLVIPKRHVAERLEPHQREWNAVVDLLKRQALALQARLRLCRLDNRVSLFSCTRCVARAERLPEWQSNTVSWANEKDSFLSPQATPDGTGQYGITYQYWPMAARSKKLTLAEVRALIQGLLGKPELGEADLLAFAQTVNGSAFKDPPPPKPKPPTATEVKNKVLAHFQCKTVTQLRKDKNFQLSMTGEEVTLKTKDDWLVLYRRFIGIPANERNLEDGPTVINGIDVLQHFRPWVVFGLDPKTATADEVREAFRRLIQQHHPDHGGDPRVAERLQTMKDSILALMP